MSAEEAVQQKYLEFQTIEQEIKMMQQHILSLSQQLLELKRLQQDVLALNRCSVDAKIYAPLGAGIYIEAALKNNTRLLLNSGANVLTFKTVEESGEIIATRITEVSKLLEQMQMTLSMRVSSHTALGEELKVLLEGTT